MQLRGLVPFALALALTACGGSTDADVADADGTAVAAEPMSPMEDVSGTLVAGDVTLQSGEFMDSYNVLAREGQWIKAEVVSGDFDPYIMVISPTGAQTDVDNSALANTSMTKAILEATEGGEWTIVVTSYEPGESGSYDLSYGALDEEPEDADEGTQVLADEDAEEETINI